MAGSVICTSSPPADPAWASAWPPCALATDATMDSPSPEPGRGPVRPERRRNGSNSPVTSSSGDVLAAVGDGEFGDARFGPGAGQHPAGGHVVLDGVVDEVGDQPFEQDPVPGDARALQRGADLDLPGRGGRGDQVDGVFDRGGQVDQLGRACIAQHGYQYWVSYQPGSRFWPFQWIEGGYLLGLSALLIAATIWLVRHRAA